MKQDQRQKTVGSGARRRARLLPEALLRHIQGFRDTSDIIDHFLEHARHTLETRLNVMRLNFSPNAAGIAQIEIDNMLGLRPVTGEPVFTVRLVFFDGVEAEQTFMQNFVHNAANHGGCLRFLQWILGHIDPSLITELSAPPALGDDIFLNLVPYAQRRRRGQSVPQILKTNVSGFWSGKDNLTRLRRRLSDVTVLPSDFFLYYPQVEARLRRLLATEDNVPTSAQTRAWAARLRQELRGRAFASRQEALEALRQRIHRRVNADPGVAAFLARSFEVVRGDDGRYELRPREASLVGAVDQEALYDSYQDARTEMDRRLDVLLEGISEPSERSLIMRSFQDALGIVPVEGKFRIARRQKSARKHA